METISIHLPQAVGNIGDTLVVTVGANCVTKKGLMGESTVELRWESITYIKFDVGTYVEVDGARYVLLEPYMPTYRNEVMFQYNPIFYSEADAWAKIPACFYTFSDTEAQTGITSREMDWSFVGNMSEAILLVEQSIKNEVGAWAGEDWCVEVDEDISQKLLQITATGYSVKALLDDISGQVEREWWVEYATNTIRIGNCLKVFDTTLAANAGLIADDGAAILRVGQDIGLPTVSDGDEEYYTRFYVFGSSRNIEQVEALTLASQVVKRLTLNPAHIGAAGYTDLKHYPNGYVDIKGHYDRDGAFVSDLAANQVMATSLFFDDIYPKGDYKVGEVFSVEKQVKNEDGTPTGETFNVYLVELLPEDDETGSAISINGWTGEDSNGVMGDLIAGKTLSIAFKSGYLQGLEFEIAYHPQEREAGWNGTDQYATSMFEIIYDNSSGRIIPNSIITPITGDKVSLFNLKMPQSYIYNAYRGLAEEMGKYLEEYQKPKSTYTAMSNSVSFRTNSVLAALELGHKVQVQYGDSEVVNGRIIEITKNLDIPFIVTLTIGNEPKKGTIKTLQESVCLVTQTVQEVVKTNSKLSTSTKNSYRAMQEMLDMVFDDDGYFTDKIRPLSIETQSLGVGAKSMQFVLNCSFQPNYNSNYNSLAIGAGTLIHYTIDSNGFRAWNIAASVNTLADTDTAYYLYAKCARSTTSATFLITTCQISCESDSNYYHFMVGIIHSAIDGYRKVSLNYGCTTINGREVCTGVISSNSGNLTIDLDNATIKAVNGATIQGSLKFVGGEDVATAVGTAQSTASNAATAAGNAQAAAQAAATAASAAQSTANTAQTAASTANTAISNINSDAIFDESEKKTVRREWYAISGREDTTGSMSGSGGSYDKAYNYTGIRGMSGTVIGLRSALDTAAENLKAYLNAVGLYTTGNFTFTTTYTRALLGQRFTLYYNAETALLNAIAAYLADQAESAANTYSDSLTVGGRNIWARKYMWAWNAYNSAYVVAGSDADGDFLAVYNSSLYTICRSNGVEYVNNAMPQIAFKENTQYCFKLRWKLAQAQSYSGLQIIVVYTDGTRQVLAYCDRGQTTITEVKSITLAGKTVDRVVGTYGEGGYTRIYDIQLTEGTKQTNGYMVAPEDVDDSIATVSAAAATAGANALLACAVTDGMSYFNGGAGVSNIFCVGQWAAAATEAQVIEAVTAGLCGYETYTYNGTAYPAPAFFAGGTFAQALQGMANIALFHSGAAKIGCFRVDTAGNVEVDNASGARRILITAGDVTAVSDIINGSGSVDSDFTLSNSASLTMAGSNETTLGTFTVAKVGTVVTIYGSCSAHVTNPDNHDNPDEPVSFGLATLQVLQGSTVVLQRSASTGRYEGDNIVNFADAFTASVAGTYTVKAVVSLTLTASGTGSVSAGISKYHKYYNPILQRIELGADGLTCIYDSTNFLACKVEGGKLLTRLFGDIQLKGTIRADGVLLSGAVTSTGVTSGTWSGYCAANCGVRKTGTGQYTITHNLGHTNYVCVANVQHNSSTSSRLIVAMVDAPAANSVVVNTKVGGTSYIDTNFYFAIIGKYEV